MSYGGDFWYVRLPDGRIFRAASTAVVRQEVASGRIPPGSVVRRSPADEWVALEWTREFAESGEHAVPSGARPDHPGAREHGTKSNRPTTVAERLDPDRLRQIGVRGLIDELLAALDSTLVRSKLVVAASAGLAFGVLATLVEMNAFDLGSRQLNATALWGAILLLIAVPQAMLTRMTYVELSRLRQARLRHGLRGLAPILIRLYFCLAVVNAVTWGLVVFFRWWPYWILPEDAADVTWWRVAAAGAALAAGMALEVCMWAVLGVSALLGPLLVVEGCSAPQGLWQWVRLLLDHLGRVFLFEALALCVGLAMTLPCAALLVPLRWLSVDPRLELAAVSARNLLLGLAGALLLAYVIVANVFIYLHLRYAARTTRTAM
jgi:hypothetical protein